MQTVFINYSSDDRQWSEWIAWQLENAGYKAVLQAWDFLPGSNFVHEMQKATSEASRIIAVLSNSYLNSRFAEAEWAAFFSRDPTGEKKLLIPVRVAKCDASGLLANIVYIDLAGKDEEEARHDLIVGLGGFRAKPDGAPRFPGQGKAPAFPGRIAPAGGCSPSTPDTKGKGWMLSIGAEPDAEGTRFRVWARGRESVEVLIYRDRLETNADTYKLEPEGDGYFCNNIKDVDPGARYRYRLNGGNSFPDPASRYQPDGVHGSSQVVDPNSFPWSDQGWHGRRLEDLVIYELHVGTATDKGTFEALIERLNDIRELGATAIQLMPAADFAGDRNWGYDGVDLFAPARIYGGPKGLRRLVDAAHTRGLAVILDVVFNHFGPDGNYLEQFSGLYFRGGPSNEWGKRINYIGKSAEPVRNFMIENARYWAIEYHVDGLRLDAIQAIEDDDEPHIVAAIVKGVKEVLPDDRSFVVVAEDEFNQPRLVQPYENQYVEKRGYGLDAIYADDFHHQVHVALAGEKTDYYIDYTGSIKDLATTIKQGWWFTGQYSEWRKRSVGESAREVAPKHLVWCLQNHDQIGNRPFGQRLNSLVTPEMYRAASALLLLSPYTPLLFMGQEWGASTPFLYFTDHDDRIGRDVTQGRADKLKNWFKDSDAKLMPGPQEESTFLRCKLKWHERNEQPHAGFLQLYTDLLKLRRERKSLCLRERGSFTVSSIGEHALMIHRKDLAADDAVLIVVNLGSRLTVNLDEEHIPHPPAGTAWSALLDTEDKRYGGHGCARFFDGGVEIEVPSVVVLGPQVSQ